MLCARKINSGNGKREQRPHLRARPVVADGAEIDIAREDVRPGRCGHPWPHHGDGTAQNQAGGPRHRMPQRRCADATASRPATLPNTNARSTETAFGAVA